MSAEAGTLCCRLGWIAGGILFAALNLPGDVKDEILTDTTVRGQSRPFREISSDGSVILLSTYRKFGFFCVLRHRTITDWWEFLGKRQSSNHDLWLADTDGAPGDGSVILLSTCRKFSFFAFCGIDLLQIGGNFLKNTDPATTICGCWTRTGQRTVQQLQLFADVRNKIILRCE